MLLAFVNIFISGIIFGVYIVELGGFSSWHSYFVNTHNFIYATFANFYFTGLMTNKVFGIANIKLVYNFLSDIPIFFFNLFYVILAAIGWSVFRIFQKGIKEKIYYVFCLILLGVGLVFDIFASLRAEIYMFNYGAYSVSFYIGALVVLTAGEWKRVQKLSFFETSMDILWRSCMYFNYS